MPTNLGNQECGCAKVQVLSGAEPPSDEMILGSDGDRTGAETYLLFI